jgi:glucosyl-dolichyl phosphate glucuronosyltransferase
MSDISILIATHNRSTVLQELLVELSHQDVQATSVEILVIHNGDSSNAKVSRPIDMAANVEFRELWVPKAGKSSALNTGLEEARGELIIFLDDDVSVSSDWLQQIVNGYRAYPREVIYCGPVIPELPQTVRSWMSTLSSKAAALGFPGPISFFLFAEFQIDAPEGPLPLTVLPSGTCFAVRASAIGDVRFRTDLGPSADNGWLMGEDTAFLRELRERWCVLSDFGGLIYLPKAIVRHRIQENKTGHDILMERFFNAGRSAVVLWAGDRIVHLNMRPVLLRSIPLETNDLRFIAGGELNYYMGQFAGFLKCNDTSRVSYFRNLLSKMRVEENKDLLSRSALKYLESV